jgi:hypothetical protein
MAAPTYQTGDADVYLKVESTAGASEAPLASTDVIGVTECSFSSPSKLRPANEMKGHMSTGRSRPNPSLYRTGRLAGIVRFASAAGAEPEIARILYGLGFKGTEDAGVSWTYDPYDVPNGPANILGLTLVKDPMEPNAGDQKQAYGVRFGNLVIKWDEANDMTWAVDFTGAHVDDVEWAGPRVAEDDDYDLSNAVAYLKDDASAFEIQSYDVKVVSMELRYPVKCVVARAPWNPTEHNYEFPCILRRNKNEPTTLITEHWAEDHATFDHWTKHRQASAGDGSLIWTDGTRELEIDLSDCQIQAPYTPAGMDPVTWRTPWECHRKADGSAQDVTMIWR